MMVAVEGLDASGKATQAKKLAEWARVERWPNVVELAFPAYESETGRAILGHLKKEWYAAMQDPVSSHYSDFGVRAPCDALVFQALQTANRLECLPDVVWEPYARRASFIIADRYTVSAMVYGSLDGLDNELLEALNCRLPQPSLYFLLDIPVEESVKRRPERRDRYEADLPFLYRVRDRYLDVFREKGPLHGYHVIDGVQDPEKVHQDILQIVAGRDHVDREGAL